MDVAYIETTRFLGAAAWTNYRVFGDSNAAAAMAAARDGINDHKRIGWTKRPAREESANAVHPARRTGIPEGVAMRPEAAGGRS